MANIFVILNGQPSYDNLCAMSPAALWQWHERAMARRPKD